jgi:hypothetical protein
MNFKFLPAPEGRHFLARISVKIKNPIGVTCVRRAHAKNGCRKGKVSNQQRKAGKMLLNIEISQLLRHGRLLTKTLSLLSLKN